ncbi:MAG: hypothetical protein PHS54_01250 [Clostridia bacterium]|nr:hypothetical protein [Clostridia bacterium]
MKKRCKKLNAMLKDEKIAPRDYGKLKKLLPVDERKKITKIQKQERSHYKTLQGIKKRLSKK